MHVAKLLIFSREIKESSKKKKFQKSMSRKPKNN